MTGYVLDSSAALAVVLGERGSDYVWDRLEGARMSAVNFAEVVTRLTALGASEEASRLVIDNYTARVVPFDVDQAQVAGAMFALTRLQGLSLGDRACLALARSLGCVALTGDRAWTQVDVGVQVEQFR